MPVPSPSQRSAIEADPRSLLVLAGPGAGKTFCLTERIRFLVERCGYDPARICAFTFTNKAAGEIAHRLEARLGRDAGRVKRGTIHAFCAELLREHGEQVGLDPGFGIADEDYQLTTLRRIEGPRRWHRTTLTQFSAFRFRGTPLHHDTLALFAKYERRLTARNVVDFDMLVLKAADLLERSAAAPDIRSRWDVVLIDEFQDLNPVQYRVIRELARGHQHVFAVGDDEQSIYSWAGADSVVFRTFIEDFELAPKIHLEENRRCPRDVFALARRLIALNPPIFTDRFVPVADREPLYPVQAFEFATDDDEAAWIIDDIRSDRAASGLDWSDVALLYRTHEIGNRLESAFLNAGIPCRLAKDRALADDPVVKYLLAALRVIASPDDSQLRDAFFRAVLPQALYDEALARAEGGAARSGDVRLQLRRMAAEVPRGADAGRQIRRALADWRNLEAVGKQHHALGSLVQELLSRRVGPSRSVLHDHHEEIRDPASLGDVVALAERLRDARERRATVWIPPMGGVDIAIKGMLVDIGLAAERGDGAGDGRGVRLSPDEVPSVGLPLGVFKAAQLLEMGGAAPAFTSFTAIDLETTDKDIKCAEIVEIAAVRVRNGVIVDTFSSLVKPRGPIAPAAAAAHGIRDADLAAAPAFGDIWDTFRVFCGDDVIVAHNGYAFDFRVLERAVRALGGSFDCCTFDTLPLARDLFPTSRKLVDLARHFGIPPGQSHRALDDSLTLARIVLELETLKLSLARKTALVDQLSHLGVALALCDPEQLDGEARLFRSITQPFALGRYTTCLEWYEREQGGDATLPTVDEVIDRLGGAARMLKIRAEKSPDERYPAAMKRLRRLIAEIHGDTLASQLSLFLERAVLSQWDGHEPERGRVNLMTLHSTKGLEFSRVYIVGAEDGQLPGGTPNKPAAEPEVQEARRLLYVGMTRTIERLVITHTAARGDKPMGGHQFLDEMALPLRPAR